MPAGAERSLTPREWSSLSAGLAEALREAQVEPLIVARPTAGARVARLWRGSTPVMAWDRSVYWPGALTDFAFPWSQRQMATLQHELQHLLEYATGDLSPLRYAVNPGNWSYDYAIGSDSAWRDYGAEQRATIVEHLWLIEHGLSDDPARGLHHRRVIPWASQT
jgi:hypothetical protein